jgi:hypothetical protein
MNASGCADGAFSVEAERTEILNAAETSRQAHCSTLVPRQSEADHCTGSLGRTSREKSEDVVGGLARLRRHANNGAIVLAKHV